MSFFGKEYLSERVIKISKISKSNKGFSSINYIVLAIIGDRFGGIGFGKSKNKDQNIACEKAFSQARNNFFRVFLNHGSIPHEIIGKHCSTTVFLTPAKSGKGNLSGTCSRFIFDIMGLKNIISKIHGANSFYNIIIATINALRVLTPPLYISYKRNKSIFNYFNNFYEK